MKSIFVWLAAVALIVAALCSVALIAESEVAERPSAALTARFNTKKAGIEPSIPVARPASDIVLAGSHSHMEGMEGSS